eukprot:2403331-Prymnesium_polylepis.1
MRRSACVRVGPKDGKRPRGDSRSMPGAPWPSLLQACMFRAGTGCRNVEVYITSIGFLPIVPTA